ncbi:MAG TPA: DUF4349 domain-containing protein [Chthonomonadaceae bacterium]|nr:DUF4349 domain-containing protein [Chthonomonadaceae bacterium]
MKTIRHWPWLLCIFGLLLAGCSSEDNGSSASSSGGTVAANQMALTGGKSAPSGPAQSQQMTVQDADEAKATKAGSADPATPKMTLAAMTESEPDRYLIKNATLTIETSDVRKAGSQLTATAQALKGYTSDSHETVDALGSRSLTVTVRVPYQQFDAFLQQNEALGKVLDKQVTAQDVTEEFVDSQSKLRNLKKTEERLLDHLSKTGKLSDTLLVETELTRVREGIEELEGKVRFMAHRIAFSTINVTFKEAARPQAMTPPESYSAGQVTSEAMRSFVGFLQGALSVVIWLAIWAVVWVPALLLARYVFRRLQKAAVQQRADWARARQSYMPPVAPGNIPPMPPASPPGGPLNN